MMKPQLMKGYEYRNACKGYRVTYPSGKTEFFPCHGPDYTKRVRWKVNKLKEIMPDVKVEYFILKKRPDDAVIGTHSLPSFWSDVT